MKVYVVQYVNYTAAKVIGVVSSELLAGQTIHEYMKRSWCDRGLRLIPEDFDIDVWEIDGGRVHDDH